MKPQLPLILISLFCANPLIHAQDAALKVISDSQIKIQFEKKLGALKDDNKTPPPEEILNQLKERTHHERELPPFAPLRRNANQISPASTTADVYDQRSQSVLCFGHIYKCDKCDKWHSSIAGGFIITEDGIAVTSYHVVNMPKAGAFGAMTINGEVYAVQQVLAASKRDDIAIVKLAGQGFTPTPIKTNTGVGSKVITISHPEGRFYSVTEGIISRYYRRTTRRDGELERMAITADFAKGSSGSPVFSADGSVAGVIASTKSIYYREEDGEQENLQMVIKTCIPGSAILKLLSPEKHAEEQIIKSAP
jgi:serine protease Do